jgi:hypothetical protein
MRVHSVFAASTCFRMKRRVEFTQIYLELMQEYVFNFPFNSLFFLLL